jgi:hypothetical protein
MKRKRIVWQRHNPNAVHYSRDMKSAPCGKLPKFCTSTIYGITCTDCRTAIKDVFNAYQDGAFDPPPMVGRPSLGLCRECGHDDLEHSQPFGRFNNRGCSVPGCPCEVFCCSDGRPPYIILSSVLKEDLEKDVWAHIAAGYMPANGVSIGGGLFAQAMILTNCFAASIKQTLSDIR